MHRGAAIVIAFLFGCGIVDADSRPSFVSPAWTANNGSPPARLGPDGVRFSLDFQGERERCFWDLSGTWDLSAVRLLAFEFTCDAPENVRAAIVYFECAGGWRLAALPIRRPGRQRWFLDVGRLESEGRPGPLSSVKRVRLSFWRNGPGSAAFVLHACGPVDPLVAVLQGEVSLPDAGERAYARRVSQRVVRWLEAMGLPAVLVPEAEFRPTTGLRVAILPYNWLLPDRVWSSVRSFREGGGHLVACYSSDARLAGLMGLRLGAYQRLTNGSQWSHIRFLEPSRIPWPAQIGQFTQHALPVTPARSDARIIAHWADDSGRAPVLPAVAVSDAGFWITHVPNSDDGPGKQWMLAGMVAELAPEAWRWIADHALVEAGRIDSFRDFGHAVDSIRATLGRVPDGGVVGDLLDRATALRNEAAQAAANGRWTVFGQRVRDVRRALTEAYARIQTPQPGERIGIWDHSGTGLYPGDWNRTCVELRRAGVTDVFVNALWAAQAHYPSDVVPASFTARSLGDQLDASIRAARRHGLRVHLWKVCWNLEGATPEAVERLRRAGALQSSQDGRPIAWLNPAVSTNADRELAAIVEAASRYPLDGIHLDYIRWPERQACFGPATRSAFEAATGRPCRRWPAEVADGGPRSNEFRRWRAGVITDFVRRCRRELQRIRPDLQLSAAVFADPADCPVSVGQDWPAWLREGLMDFVCPMNYDENLHRFAARCAAHLALPGAVGRIWEGIGASAGESQLLADQVIEQVVEARRRGAAGFVLFDLSPTVRDHVLPMLPLGLTRPR